MSADHHCSSRNRREQSVKLASLALLVTMGLAGCNTSRATSALNLEGVDKTSTASISENTNVKQQTIPDSVVAHTTNDEKSTKTANKDDKTQSKATKEATNRGIDPTTTKSIGYALPSKSSYCRFLEADANAQAAIMASPTLGASSDDEGSYSVNLGMNILDFGKAKLVREMGYEKCRQHEAMKAIKTGFSMMKEGVAAKTAQAKYDYLHSKRDELDRISNAVNNAIAAGNLSRPQGATIKHKIKLLLSEMQQAKADAAAEEALPSLSPGAINRQASNLRKAERRLQEINRKMRTLDALNVKLEGGYREIQKDEVVRSNSSSDDFYGKINVGVRLGALSRKRREYELLAQEARQMALDENQEGILWASDVGATASGEAVESLRKAEKELLQDRAEVTRIRRMAKISGRSDLLPANLSARIDEIVIGARLAEARAGIKQLSLTSDIDTK